MDTGGLVPNGAGRQGGSHTSDRGQICHLAEQWRHSYAHPSLSSSPLALRVRVRGPPTATTAHVGSHLKLCCGSPHPVQRARLKPASCQGPGLVQPLARAGHSGTLMELIKELV